MHERERVVLWQVCRELDIGRVELAQLLDQRWWRTDDDRERDLVLPENIQRLFG